MNWLAHLHLSEPTPTFRLGGLLPDLVTLTELKALPAEFAPGIRRHVQIDAYTDSHPIVRQSIQRLKPPYRRFGGILVDVFYDHFLARRWRSYSEVPFPDFVNEAYASLEKVWHSIPDSARLRLQYMRTEDWLTSYLEINGVANALNRIGKRLRQPIELGKSVELLESEYVLYESDFAAFYPELQAAVLR